MCPSDEDRERLEQELQGSAYQALLRQLQRRHLFLCRFSAWADAIAFMRDGTSRDPRKDEVLRPIFEAHAQDQDPRWRTILMAIFWPGLNSIHIRKRGWDKDSDERWQNVVWTFLQVLCRIDLERRSDRLVQKIYNDTIHQLYDEYRRGWNRTNPEFTAGVEEIDALIGGVEGVEFAAVELREVQKIETERLRGHMDAGRITESDFLLLIGTRLYGKSVADCARKMGLNYQVVKKRRQRAEAAIRRFEEEKQQLL